MFEYKDLHNHTWHEDTLGCRMMISFVIVSLDLWLYVLDTWVTTGAMLSTDHQVVGILIRWHDGGCQTPLAHQNVL